MAFSAWQYEIFQGVLWNHANTALCCHWNTPIRAEAVSVALLKNASILNVSWSFIYILINHCSNTEEDSKLMQHVIEWFYLLQELSNCSCDDCGYGNLLLGAFTLRIPSSLKDRKRCHYLITEVLRVL